ncbi:MAG: anti-phage dCTP deaminase [Acetobacter orientalis]|uniref:anti-phage dCTP deaminase n=1 Tax=Acetobacter orientalis TaxID=146474 RepID=UPI0039EAF373
MDINVENILRPSDAELFIGIVSQIGVDTKSVVNIIEKELSQYKYDVHDIHITDFIKGFSKKIPLDDSTTEKRYSSYIDGCNILRKDFGNDVMAKVAIAQIIEIRKNNYSGQDDLNNRNVFIINQIKRPEESEILRKIYGEQYIQISCHAEEEIRVKNLQNKISKDHFEDPKSSKWDLEARTLVNKDSTQEGIPHGQRVRQVFPSSDVVIDFSDSSIAQKQLDRFFRALFGDSSVTPTPQEYGMELACTAALRSSDLSRQVGAAILTKNMEVQALGCNEVPKFGGGTYWEGSEVDARDFTLGYDSNEQRRRAVLLDLIYRLKTANALSEELTRSSPRYIEEFLFSENNKLISDSQMMDSLEYGRSVHAEMNAITDAARGGHAIRKCTLFTNTFPCHNCAKHIVASGIEDVYYIHPYPKSYAKELFCDSIEIDPPKADDCKKSKVGFKQFIGIMGPLYKRMFTKTRWKITGGIIPKFSKENSSYIRNTSTPSYGKIEELILDMFYKDLRKKGYM